MKKQNEAKLFAFKVSEKTQQVQSSEQWKARDGVSTAGCSGMFSRADDYYRGRDQGIYC
ncbi:hypothetical protein [Kangiella taiwanensis]|uniref:Uncharacterized protein n=1 Tax=Kangiella taiwanensis TaxID=1079179 RepID=A0ABP8I768_9GAMM|nr:hypothetical protein [Kangiella taiwanensis]